jgi:hypothetical protein
MSASSLFILIRTKIVLFKSGVQTELAFIPLTFQQKENRSFSQTGLPCFTE